MIIKRKYHSDNFTRNTERDAILISKRSRGTWNKANNTRETSFFTPSESSIRL